MGLCLTLLFTTGCGLLPEEEELKKAPVMQSIDDAYFSTTTVKTGDIVDYFTVRGKYQKKEAQTQTLKSNGEQLRGLYVNLGDKVKVGDVLAELTVGELDSQIESQQEVCAGLARKQEYLSGLVSIEKDRIALAKKYGHAYDEEKFENLSADLAKAEDEYYIADLRLGELNEELNKRRMVSNVSGVVTEIEYLHGWDWGKITGVKITVESETYGFVFNTDEVTSFPIGTVCEVEMDDGTVLNAEVVTCIATNDEGTMVKVTMEPLLSAEAPAKAGSGTIKVVKDTGTNVTYVPAGALRRVGDDYAVYVVNSDGMRERRIVEIGLYVSGKATSDDNRVEIKNGVTTGEEVIIR